MFDASFYGLDLPGGYPMFLLLNVTAGVTLVFSSWRLYVETANWVRWVWGFLHLVITLYMGWVVLVATWLTTSIMMLPGVTPQPIDFTDSALFEVAGVPLSWTHLHYLAGCLSVLYSIFASGFLFYRWLPTPTVAAAGAPPTGGWHVSVRVFVTVLISLLLLVGAFGMVFSLWVYVAALIQGPLM